MTAARVLPRDADLGRTLRRFWAESGRVAQHRVADDTHLLDLGVDSLGLVSLEVRIATEFNIDLPDHALIEAPTPGEMAELVAECRATTAPPRPPDPASSIVTVQRGDDRAPLFAIPGGGGDNMARLAWMARLADPRRTVVGLGSHTDPDAPPGRGWLARRGETYADEIAAARPEGPVLLFGDCLAGLVAWETALTLEERGRTPVHLMLLDGMAEARRDDEAARWPRSTLLRGAAPRHGFGGDLWLVSRHGDPWQRDATVWEAHATGDVRHVVLPPHILGHSFRADAMPHIVATVRQWLDASDLGDNRPVGP